MGQVKQRRGAALIYGTIVVIALCAIASLAVDYGRAQMIKGHMQRVCDATAHDYIVLYNSGGTSYANANGPSTYQNSPVNGASPRYNVTWGRWNSNSRNFSTTSSSGDIAVRVTASCTAAGGNPIRLFWAALVGRSTLNVTVNSVAASTPSTSTSVSIDSKSDLYFAGMPPGTASTYGDNATNNPATQVVGIPVRPGDVITFSTFTGTTSVLPGYMPYFGPAGAVGHTYGSATHHGVSWNGAGSAYDEFGIADAVMPESALCGLFLSDDRPDLTPAPPCVDWTNPAIGNRVLNDDLVLKAPFMIGTGVTSGGAVKKFVVPDGATRLYVAAWDGLQFNNNGGSLSGTVTVQRAVRIVR
jgi:hypothetical protein